MIARREPPPEPGALAGWLTPARTALLVVDMQVDFASPDGAMGRAGVDLSSVPAALRAAERLVAAARAAGVAVIFAGLKTQPELDSGAWRERLRRLDQDPDQMMAVCRADDPGSAFVGPTPAAGELVVDKLRYSAFVGGDLDQQLTRRGLDTLVVCGLTTDCCVDCTVRDAFDLDFHVFVAGDACAAYEADLHAATLRSLGLNCAIVTDSAQVVQAWANPP